MNRRRMCLRIDHQYIDTLIPQPALQSRHTGERFAPALWFRRKQIDQQVDIPPAPRVIQPGTKQENPCAAPENFADGSLDDLS